MKGLLLGLLALAASVSAGPLWDYVHTDDGMYSYFDTGVRLNQQTGWTG